MARMTDDAELTRELAALAVERPRPPDATMIAAIVETVLSSLSGDMSVANLKLYHEIELLAQYIQTAKREIAAIQPRDIRERHIPMATDHLDAVVEATAEATGAILGAAEAIERRTPEMPAETAAAIAAEVTRIYEACNFQDITGQRITKVVGTLKHIETKVDALLAAFGEDVNGMAVVAAPAEADEALVNGPQLPGNANNQAEIDALLASLD
jgi:chemotaxis protein CheZ